jgi:hypothetical protein
LTSTRRATSYWSRPNGTTQTGTPPASAFWVAPMPPWVTAQAARARIGACGANSRAVPFAGGRSREASPAGSVATTWRASPASASKATSARRPSSWNSVEVLTSTSGASIPASSLGSSPPGSHEQGPTITTLAGQSGRRYSNGSALV